MSIKPQAGFTLVEVMVSVLVLAIGLLGLAHLQITSLKVNQSAAFRSQATVLASDMLDRMRANQDAAHNGNYSLTLADNAPATPSTVAENDVAGWMDLLTASLPEADASINCPAFVANTEFVCTITINWTEMQDDNQLGTTSFIYSGAV